MSVRSPDIMKNLPGFQKPGRFNFKGEKLIKRLHMYIVVSLMSVLCLLSPIEARGKGRGVFQTWVTN
jgi:hypothetical protein